MYGRDHAEVAITLGNLGAAYGDLGDYAKKREYITRTVKIFEGAYGPDHPHAAYYRNVLDTMWVYDKERAYGNDHPHTKLCQGALAKLPSA